MRAVVFALAVLLVLAPAVLFGPAPAVAAEARYVEINGERARLLACFKEVLVPAKYSVKHVLLTPAKRQYVKRLFGRIDLVEIPAVYVEEKTLVEPEHILLRQVVCD